MCLRPAVSLKKARFVFERIRMNRILVAPIAFNEYVKLEQVIERFLKSPVFNQVDFCVVDDYSTDGTPQMIARYAVQKVTTLRNAKRMGVGASIRRVIEHARSQGYEALVIMAGNNKDNPDEIPVLIEPIAKNGYDFVQGSRYLKHKGAGGDMPFYRRMATRLHPWLMSLITGRKLTDSTNGFRAFKLSIFDNSQINLNQDWLNQYELEPYILYKVLTLGYQFTEVPVTKIYPPKKLGYSKMRPIIGWWSIMRPIIYLGLKIKK